ncbi:MAG TPA: hypothetical protein PKW80_03245 [Bacteroidales bacterium]|nr:hypothetical protein [Bacteroidales bacterium]
MKIKLCIALGICALVLVFTSCGPSGDEAIDYNDKIIDEQTKIVDKINVLYETMNLSEHPEQMHEAYKHALIQIDSGAEKVSKMNDFDGNTGMREGAVKLFSMYKSVVQTEIRAMIEILEKPEAENAAETESRFNEIQNLALKKMDAGLAEFQEVQLKFADKYNFELTPVAQ